MNAPHEPARPDWDVWALGIAAAIASRGDCTRRRVGACILDRQHRVIGAGYNGTEPGGRSCLKGDCPRGRHYSVGCLCGGCHDGECTSSDDCGLDGCGDPVPQCACGGSWPCENAVEPGSSYDTGPGACVASHAEQTALADVEARYRLAGATMFVTEEPCEGCTKQIRNTTEIARIVWPRGELLVARGSGVRYVDCGKTPTSGD